ncbi:MAG: MmgE/PrpD family protein [Saccharofermentanales bacterium]|jgi:hypothetical protein|nr:MmgE/PrpD family protein [Clostridiaceae bacterium]
MREDLKSPGGTNLLCKNVVETTYESLSEDNIRIFKDRLLDVTGCMFGGAIVAEDAFLEQRYRKWGGIGEAPLFASYGRLPLPVAAKLNCLKARANDFGSMLFRVFGEAIPSHVSETAIPLSLTLGDTFGVSGKQLITYDVAAEDFTARLLYSLPNRWPTDMLLVSSAAAALAGRYYGLDAEQMKSALSYAATNATDPANAYYDYSQEFKLHNGVSAETGILSAEYAKGGWRGLEDPYFGHWGLISKHVEGGVLPPLYEKCFEDLGKVYFTEGGFKYSPGGIPTTAAVFCGRKLHRMLKEAYGEVNGADIRRIRVFGSKNIYHGYYSNPFVLRDQINALFSYRFTACCATLNGSVGVDVIQTAAIRADEDLVRLAESATMDIYEPEDHGRKIKVVAEMHDGRVFTAEENFMVMERYPTQEELVDKFWGQFNAFGKLPKSNGEKIIELASRIEELSDVREYTELLYIKE